MKEVDISLPIVRSLFGIAPAQLVAQITLSPVAVVPDSVISVDTPSAIVLGLIELMIELLVGACAMNILRLQPHACMLQRITA